jgi:hypothetical protein
MNRSPFQRLIIVLAAVAMLLPGLLTPSTQAQEKKVLFLTKSQGFQHSVIQRDAKDPEKLAYAERLLTEIGKAHGYQVTCTKDASLFNNPETYKTYDIFAFYTTGDLTRDDMRIPKLGADGKPVMGTNRQPVMDEKYVEKGMSEEGKKMFLQSIADGKGFIAFHSASDTFHSRGSKELLRPSEEPAKVDPYIVMLGGEFVAHGSQQVSTIKIVPGFPGLEDLADYKMNEEWYALINLAPDLHAVLIQDTSSMVTPKGKEKMYDRPAYPSTWAKAYGKGRVFYTSMGHREDVWTNPVFVKVLVAGLDWAAGKTQADVTPNMEKVAPQPAGK